MREGVPAGGERLAGNLRNCRLCQAIRKFQTISAGLTARRFTLNKVRRRFGKRERPFAACRQTHMPFYLLHRYSNFKKVTSLEKALVQQEKARLMPRNKCSELRGQMSKNAVNVPSLHKSLSESRYLQRPLRKKI